MQVRTADAKEFKVVVKPREDNRKPHLVRVYVDGRRIEGYIRKQDLARQGEIDSKLEKQGCAIVKRSLCFASVVSQPWLGTLADQPQTWVEGQSHSLRQPVDGLGTVEVVISFGTVGQAAENRPVISSAPRSTLDERCKRVSCVWLAC